MQHPDEPDAAARGAIESLALQSLRLIDEGRAVEVAGLFAPEAALVVDGVRVEGEDGIFARYAARMAQRGVVSRHALNNLRLRAVTGGTVSGSALLTVYKGATEGAECAMVVADLDDLYGCLPGQGWRILERRLRTVFRMGGVR